MTDPQQDRRFGFGTFEADAATGELRRQGIRVRLNAQPFQVLCMLLERPGDLLAREEISRELWPDGTFVDYEHGVGLEPSIESAKRLATRPPIRGSFRRSHAGAIGLLRRWNGSVRQQSRRRQALNNPQNQYRSKAVRSSRPRTTCRRSPLPWYKLFSSSSSSCTSPSTWARLPISPKSQLFSVLPYPALSFDALLITAATLIPVRAFILFATVFHAPGARTKLLLIWRFLLLFDELWALSPFLLLHHINFGLAFACTALLVYSPFAQRSLVLMGAGSVANKISLTDN